MAIGREVRSRYLPGIDGLRAVAVSAVLLFHMDAFPFLKGGFTGVDLFLVISGYVICKSLGGRPERSLLPFIAGFYKRRLVRIAPALIAMLLAATLASALFIPSAWMSRDIDATGLSAFLAYSNIRLAFDGENYFSPALELNPFLHTWSLGLEEQFYLFFPFLYFLYARTGAGRRETGPAARGPAGRIIRALAVCLLPALACASLAISVYQSSASGKTAYYLLPSRFWELALGALLFRAHDRGLLSARGAAASGFLVAGGLVLAGAGFLMADAAAFPFPWALPAALGAAAALCGIAGNGNSLPARMLAGRAAAFVGRISYSLYLWHWPVAVLFRWTFGFSSILSKALYVLVSFALAAASHRFVESPIRKSSLVARAKGLPFFVASLAAVGISFLAARAIWDSRSEISLSATKDEYAWQSRRDRGDGPLGPVIDDPRVAGRRLFAIGDSHVAAYRTMLDVVSKELGIEVYEFEEGDCAVPGLLWPMSERAREHYERSVEEVRKLARPGDLVFLAGLRMPTFADQFEASDVEAIARDHLGREAILGRALALEEARAIIRGFEDTGARVALEAPLPVLLAPPYRCSDWFNRMNPVGANGLTVKRSFLEELREPVLDSIRSLSKGDDRLLVWDPFPVLCDREVFSAFDERGSPIFWDGDHLSGNGNRMLAPSFRDFLLALWTGE